MAIVNSDDLQKLFDATPGLSARARKQLTESNQPKPDKPVRGSGAAPRGPVAIDSL